MTMHRVDNHLDATQGRLRLLSMQPLSPLQLLLPLPRLHRMARWLAALCAAAYMAPTLAAQTGAATPACKGTLYLTFDTGSQSQAQLIAQTLQRHQVKATFFLANEKTVNGDFVLDSGWADYWRARVAEGHAFGSHSWDHLVAVGDRPGGKIEVKPGFGAGAGRVQVLDAKQYCQQLRAVDTRFAALTGQKLDPIWRAPAGRLTPNAIAAARACGYAHVGWSPAGFSGDELPSERFPNAVLLQRALRDLKDGDIFMAHMGIRSRHDAWAPANLAPLIEGLQRKGFCFATLRQHPAYALPDPSAAGSSTTPSATPLTGSAPAPRTHPSDKTP
jgi:peptidoglycan/xylan/chitin deacetylase (PgdA/CDA1 family)